MRFRPPDPYQQGIQQSLNRIQQTLGLHTQALNNLNTKADNIMSEQANIDAVTTGIESEVADLGVQDAAILAAQQAFAAELAVVGKTVDTTKLVAAAAALLTAQGADDATVAALTAAAAPPVVPPAP